jgi:hypothetical protein
MSAIQRPYHLNESLVYYLLGLLPYYLLPAACDAAHDFHDLLPLPELINQCLPRRVIYLRGVSCSQLGFEGRDVVKGAIPDRV